MKNHKPENSNSRRKFIKTGALVTVGTIALGGPLSKILSEFFNGAGSDESELLTCELFRFRDLLHLKYYFFNIDVKKSSASGKLVMAEGAKEIYLYIELPPQHISEEFLDNEEIKKTRKEFKRKKSFLANKSWLAFKVNQVKNKNVEVKLDAIDLLDWNNKFSLITLDDVLFSKELSSPYHNTKWRSKTSKLDISTECNAIKDLVYNIISVYQKKHESAETDRQNLYNKGEDAFLNRDGNRIPLSTFEVPYKMMLSPINDTDLGRYMFESNDLLSLYNKNGVHIRAVWHNNLKYATVTGERTDPRFKIVNYLNANEQDKDKLADSQIVKLQPAPIHRMDLHNLTLIPEKERDVTSKQFEFSALGASASLHYKHPDPFNHALVAWDQEINIARDNYASVTYRAIDLFTGFKLLFTVLIERTYVDKVSFMRRRYFVSFAEKEKEYGFMFNPKTNPQDPDENDETVSRTPFEKIIALSDGAYFKPVRLPKLKAGLKDDEEEFVTDENNQHVYAALIEGRNAPLIPENYLVFNYIGIDKQGKEHAFSSKMSIIFPEEYEIIPGEKSFKYIDELGQEKEIKSGVVDIKYLDQLDPANLLAGVGCDIGVIIPDFAKGKSYAFQRKLVFDTQEDRNSIKDSIAQARRIFTFKSERLNIDRIKQFEQVVKGSITYAKIEALRTKNGSADSIISATSTASTFETNNFFLFSELNPSHHPNDRPYLKKHPLVPELFQANVIIPQIDQIEGQSMLRPVEFAKDYINGKNDLDQYFERNNKYLFFQLKKKQADFFKDNYRKAGGMVDPGISITHISALDNGITYNDLHNRIAEATGKDKTVNAVSSAKAISSISIFGEANAQIVGIPLRAIIDVILSEFDIPVFKFKQDLDDTLNQFEKLKREFGSVSGVMGNLQSQYDAAKKQYEDSKAQYEKAVARVDQLRKMSLYEWVETLVQQKELIYASKIHKQAIEAFYNVKTEALITESTKNLKINAVALKSLFEDFRKTVMDQPLAAAEKKAADILNNFSGYSEEVVAVLIVEFLKHNETLKKELLNKDVPSQFLTKWKEISKQFPEDQRLYGSLRKWDNYIKTIENLSQQYQNELTKIGEKAEEGINRALHALPELLANVLNDLPIIKVESKDSVAAFVRMIMEIETVKNTLGIFETEMRKLNHQGLEKLMFEYRAQLTKNNEIVSLEKAFNEYSEDFKTKVIDTQNSFDNLLTEVSEVYRDKENLFGPEVANIIVSFETYKSAVSKLVANKKIILPEYASSELGTVLEAFESFGQCATEFKDTLDKDYADAVSELNGLQVDFEKYEKEYKSFVTDALKQLKGEIDKKEQEVRAALSDIEAYNKALKDYNQLKLIYTRLSQPVNMELNYQFAYNKFRRSSFAGVVDFIPNKNKTQLSVDVSYSTKFQLTNLNPDGLKVTNSYHTKSALSDFKIGLAQIIFVDFASVSFVSGSDVKDDFMVKIRSVDFGGIMAFVDAFKEYLKSLDNNLVFDLNTSRAQIGYGISLPNITAGAFNFFNLNLSALLVLPFDPKKSLQLQFGFGNELNKFGITVSGIFGGQGYFILIAEPKRGIIALVIVLEFGAIFNLHLGVASGTAYLVGGVYIRREKLPSGNDLVEYRAYILAVGRLRIVGLFSASLTFYVGLHGNGPVLKGVATVTASKRFSRFFEISVSVSYEKTLRGAKREEIDQPKQDNLFFHTLDIFPAKKNTHDSVPIKLSKFDLDVEDIRSMLILTENENGNYSIELPPPDKRLDKLIVVKGLYPNGETTDDIRDLKEFPSKLDDFYGVFSVVIPIVKDNEGSVNYLLPITVIPKSKSTTKKTMEIVSVEEYYASYY